MMSSSPVTQKKKYLKPISLKSYLILFGNTYTEVNKGYLKHKKLTKAFIHSTRY